MILTILIAFASLIGLIVLHELGHFVLAKRFGVKVEEFGIGIPPRLIGKKIGETIYSLNLLPIGAFVRLYGEEEQIKDPRSFSGKSVRQRALIVAGGVVTFWIVSAVLLSIVMALGAPTVVEDNQNHNLQNPKVQIVAVAAGSPAEEAGLKPGDTIKQLSINNQWLSINKVKEVQEFTEINKGKEITLSVQRGKETLNTSFILRSSPPEGEGPIGIALVRTAIISYPWYQAPFQGILATGNLTIAIIQGWAQALGNIIKGVPTGVQLMGPIGISSLFVQVAQLGVVYFLQFIAIISIHLALFNSLPIPAVDGGKLLFLGMEAIRRKPLNQKLEQHLSVLSFVLLITLMIWVTIKDIIRLF